LKKKELLKVHKLLSHQAQYNVEKKVVSLLEQAIEAQELVKDQFQEMDQSVPLTQLQ
jgi:hypothetical protein